MLLYTLIEGALLSGCQGDSKGPKSAPLPEEKISYTNKEGTLISNGIALETTGVKVSRAFLLYDNSTLVPPGNKTTEGRRIRLRLLIEKGWKELDDKVALGASQTITTDQDQIVLHEKDLFATTPMMDVEAAKVITLNAAISKLGRKQENLVVSFRVWDKQGDGEIKGSYKMFVEQDK